MSVNLLNDMLPEVLERTVCLLPTYSKLILARVCTTEVKAACWTSVDRVRLLADWFKVSKRMYEIVHLPTVWATVDCGIRTSHEIPVPFFTTNYVHYPHIQVLTLNLNFNSMPLPWWLMEFVSTFSQLESLTLTFAICMLQ